MQYIQIANRDLVPFYPCPSAHLRVLSETARAYSMFQKYFCSLSAQTQKGKHTMQSSSKHWNRLNGSTARFPRKAFWQRALYLVFVCTVLLISYNAWANRFLYFALKLMQAEQVTVIDCTPPVRLTDQQWDDLHNANRRFGQGAGLTDRTAGLSVHRRQPRYHFLLGHRRLPLLSRSRRQHTISMSKDGAPKHSAD